MDSLARLTTRSRIRPVLRLIALAALEQHTAGADGILHLELSSADLPPGWYALVAHGLWSGITAVAPFQIE